jgi:hypothetical protein
MYIEVKKRIGIYYALFRIRMILIWIYFTYLSAAV